MHKTKRATPVCTRKSKSDLSERSRLFWPQQLLGSFFGRLDFFAHFYFGARFFADFVTGFFLLVFV